MLFVMSQHLIDDPIERPDVHLRQLLPIGGVVWLVNAVMRGFRHRTKPFGQALGEVIHQALAFQWRHKGIGDRRFGVAIDEHPCRVERLSFAACQGLGQRGHDGRQWFDQVLQRVWDINQLFMQLLRSFSGNRNGSKRVSQHRVGGPAVCSVQRQELVIDHEAHVHGVIQQRREVDIAMFTAELAEDVDQVLSLFVDDALHQVFEHVADNEVAAD